MSYNKKNKISNKVGRGRIYGRFANVLFANVLGTLSNENVDVPDVKNGNRKLIFSFFQCSDSTNSYSGSRNKGIQIRCVRQKCSIKRDIELPVGDVSGTSAFSLLELTIKSFSPTWQGATLMENLIRLYVKRY